MKLFPIIREKSVKIVCLEFESWNSLYRCSCCFTTRNKETPRGTFTFP